MSPSTSILSVRNNELLQQGFGLILHENTFYRRMSRCIVKYIELHDEILYINFVPIILNNEEKLHVETKLSKSFLQ